MRSNHYRKTLISLLIVLMTIQLVYPKSEFQTKSNNKTLPLNKEKSAKLPEKINDDQNSATIHNNFLQGIDCVTNGTYDLKSQGNKSENYAVKSCKKEGQILEFNDEIFLEAQSKPLSNCKQFDSIYFKKTTEIQTSQFDISNESLVQTKQKQISKKQNKFILEYMGSDGHICGYMISIDNELLPEIPTNMNLY